MPFGDLTFGDFGDKFLAAVVGSGFRDQEVHVIFDRYEQNAIKAGTRERRTKTTRPIPRVFENRNVPLPCTWSNLLALPEKKADLAGYLSSILSQGRHQIKYLLSLKDLTIKKKHNVQTRKRTQAYST